jgi:putative peptidoglycan lipid II flippase
MSRMLKSSGAMGFATLLSRILGLVREQVYAHFMGDSAVAGAFKLAYQIPNLLRRLLGEGALTAAFVPVFKQKEKLEGEEEMWRAANAVMSGLVVAAAAISLLVILGISLVLALASMHYTRDGQPVFPPFPLPILKPDTRLMLQLLRIMFPYLVLVCLAAMCMGMLNARGHFFIPAMGAATLNVVMIGTVLFATPWFGKELETQIFALALGVLVAGFAQFLFQVPTLWKDGFRYRWVSPWRNETVRVVLQRMVPGALGVAAYQINVLTIQGVAFWVDPSIVASFDYAVRLMEFPQGVVGISLATYLLSALSGLAADKDYAEFRSTLRQGLGYLLFVNVLASVLLVVLAEPIVRLLFERGQFGPAATQNATKALICLAPGLVFFSVVNVVARAFFALGDTQTPMKISTVCLGLNLLVAVALVSQFRQAGLGAANTATAAMNAGLLLYALRRKLARLELDSLKAVVGSLVGAAAAAGGVAWAVFHFWESRLGHQTLLLRTGEVCLPLLAATAVYLGVCFWCRVPQAREIFGLAVKPFRGGGDPSNN